MSHSARRALGSLLASALIHLVVLGLLEWLLPPKVDRESWLPAVRRYRPLPVRRHEPRAPVPVSREMVRRVLGLESSLAALAHPGDASPAPLPETPPPVAEAIHPLDIKQPREREPDSVPDSVMWKDQVTDLPIPDPVELDAQRRRRNVAIIAPATGKLERAWLHLPAYGRPLGAQIEAAAFLRGGHKLPGPVPLEIEFHLKKLGRCGALIEGIGAEPDPIHGFAGCPERHILHRSEMREFSVLHLGYIDVESLEAMVEYLVQGGFAIMSSIQMALCEAGLDRRYGSRVERQLLEPGHPLFHSFFDITRYAGSNAPCTGFGPVPALVLDGRVTATTPPPGFNTRYPCPANQVFVNHLAFALIQPSAMGGRYEARR